MARVSGVDIPREKRVEVALTYVFGIGRTLSQQTLAETGVNPNTRVRDLSEEELAPHLMRMSGMATQIERRDRDHRGGERPRPHSSAGLTST